MDDHYNMYEGKTTEEIQAWIDEATRDEYWLVFVFHQISDSCYKWGCKPAMLDIVCTLLNKSDSTILTVSEACEMYHRQ